MIVFLFLLPVTLLAVVSFGRVDLTTYVTQLDFQPSNYLRALDPLYLRPVLWSFATAATATLACLVVGFPVALTLSRWEGRRQRLLLGAVVVPLWISFAVRTYGLVAVLSDSGPVFGFLHRIGLPDSTPELLYTPVAVVIGMVYSYLPLMVLPIFVALERIEPTLLLAAADLGAGPWSQLLRVQVRLAAPGIVAGCLLVGVPAIGEYVVPAILGGGKVMLYGNIVARQFQEVGDYPLGSALTMLLIVAVSIVLIVGRRATARVEDVT
ncbi:ABC transporter permease [Micromonospora sp. DT44]|uniref:ABC transporter permease n=1 Tax=Micromonospora sp. DT44 TaxID=3393439 RepID=UPI003CF6632D